MPVESGNGDDSKELNPCESEIHEPYVGMEFVSEDEARDFYAEYARRLGFVVRLMQRRRSGIDGRTLSRRLGCNKQGFSPKNLTNPEKKPHSTSAREGCKATILVKMEKSGKWIVTRFNNEHNHPLILTASPHNSLAEKDKQIQELKEELEFQDRLCSAYRNKLLSFMNNVEHQNQELSLKFKDVVENIKNLESEMQSHENHM